MGLLFLQLNFGVKVLQLNFAMNAIDRDHGINRDCVAMDLAYLGGAFDFPGAALFAPLPHRKGCGFRFNAASHPRSQCGPSLICGKVFA